MEIPFEYLLAAIESPRGTPAASATRYLNLRGTVTPRKARYRPAEARGLLAEHFRSIDIRKWIEWEAEGPCDLYTLPLLLNTIVAGGIDGSGSTDAELTTALTGDNNDLVYTAVDGGNIGNDISVEYIDPDAASQALEIDVVDKRIKVWLATDADKIITTIADDISAAIAAHPTASLLVTVADAAANDGSGLVTAMSRSYLTGGEGADIITPDGATDARLWLFAPTLDADDLEAMTLFWGDPNVQAFRSGFCMPDELTITADASGDEGVMLSINGQGLFPSKTAPSSVPSFLTGPILLPGNASLSIDDTTIGSTPVTGRLVSAEITIPSGISRKWLAQGATGTLGFADIGRGLRHAELRLVLEAPDTTEYDQWVAATSLKTRLRLNGPLIEVGFYHYLEFYIYGPFDSAEWGENQDSNRTLELAILSEYDDDAGYDFCVRLQTDREAL